MSYNSKAKSKIKECIQCSLNTEAFILNSVCCNYLLTINKTQGYDSSVLVEKGAQEASYFLLVD